MTKADRTAAPARRPLDRALPAGMRRQAARWLGAREGVVALELALMSAFIIVPLLIGTYEVSRYIMAANKVDRVAQTLAQLVARNQNLDEATVNAGSSNFLSAGAYVASPFNIRRDGDMTVSLLANRTGNRAVILWQFATTAGQSRLGAKCATVTLPTAAQPIVNDAGEFVVIAEAEIRYQPLIFGSLFNDPANNGLTTLYARSYYQPRFASLPPVGSNPGDC